MPAPAGTLLARCHGAEDYEPPAQPASARDAICEEKGRGRTTEALPAVRTLRGARTLAQQVTDALGGSDIFGELFVCGDEVIFIARGEDAAAAREIARTAAACLTVD